MSTTVLRFLTAGFLGASLLGAGAAASNTAPNSAVTPSIGGIGVASSTAVGPGKTLPSMGGDDIVQFASLQIQSISGNVVTAAQMQDVYCITAPCPKMPDRLFKIKVSARTILLLRTRTRATLANFAVGDNISVYGFLDGSTLDALILRDLDKPLLITPVELHNMEITAISGNSLTVQYHLECRGNVCPMYGIPSGGAPSSPQPVMPSLYPMPRLVNVNSNTKFLDRNGASIGFGNLKVGDLVDVYGSFRGSDFNAPLQAKTIRDNSIPTVSSGTLSIVSFTGPGTLGVNQSGEWKVQVSGGDQSALTYSVSWGDERATSMIPEPAPGQNISSSGSFTHAYGSPGSYVIRVTVTDAQGASATATMSAYVYNFGLPM